MVLSDLSLREFALKVLNDSKKAMTDKEIWDYGVEKGWDKELKNNEGKTPWQSIYSILSNYKKGGKPQPEEHGINFVEGTRRKFILSTYNADVVNFPLYTVDLDGFHDVNDHPLYPDDLPDDSIEYREGKKKCVAINIYERNPNARKECIKYYGSKCFICKFDFGKKYGEEFNGVIHVHHLKMISEADSEYTVDPVNDLRPVCPNCHMVLHGRKDGYTIEEVIEMLKTD